MPVERREQVTHIRVESTVKRMSSFLDGKAAAFFGWHEPYESRDSRTDLRAARGEIPRADSATKMLARKTAIEIRMVGIPRVWQARFTGC